jgi:hypothetical protein
MVKGFKKLILLARNNTRETPYLYISSTQSSIDSTGGMISVNVQSNIEWEISETQLKK